MVARELVRIIALVSLIIAFAAFGVAVTVLAGIAIDWLAGVAKIALAWILAHDRAAGALVACAIVLMVVALKDR